MEQKKLNQINSITNGFHDLSAEINEEFVDGNKKAVIAAVDKFIIDLKDFRSNMVRDEI